MQTVSEGDERKTKQETKKREKVGNLKLESWKLCKINRVKCDKFGEVITEGEKK